MGLENITANSGWAMAIVGYVTVTVALTILATIISFLPKIIVLVDRYSKRQSTKATSVPMAKPEETALPRNLPGLDVSVLTAEYGPYVGKLSPTFELKDLYILARENDLEHPHLSVKALQEAGKLAPVGDGLYKWNA